MTSETSFWPEMGEVHERIRELETRIELLEQGEMNGIQRVRALLASLKNKVAMPGKAKNGVQGIVSSVSIRRDGGVAITVYCAPIERPGATDLKPGTTVSVSA